jgi:hypothetical protein
MKSPLGRESEEETEPCVRRDFSKFIKQVSLYGENERTGYVSSTLIRASEKNVEEASKKRRRSIVDLATSNEQLFDQLSSWNVSVCRSRKTCEAAVSRIPRANEDAIVTASFQDSSRFVAIRPRTASPLSRVRIVVSIVILIVISTIENPFHFRILVRFERSFLMLCACDARM